MGVLLKYVEHIAMTSREELVPQLLTVCLLLTHIAYLRGVMALETSTDYDLILLNYTAAQIFIL